MKFKGRINWQCLFDTVEKHIQYQDTFLLFKQAALETLIPSTVLCPRRGLK